MKPIGLDELTLPLWDRAARAYNEWRDTLYTPGRFQHEEAAWGAYEEARRELPLLVNTPSGVALGGRA